MKKLLLIVLLFLAGCKVATNEEGKKTYQLDPNTTASVETGAEGAAGILTVLTPFLGPSATIAATGILTALGVWRKLKPRFVAAQDKATMAHTVAGSLVGSIEILKKSYPEDWKHLEPTIVSTLEASGVDTQVLDNVIRGLRGLPPKG